MVEVAASRRPEKRLSPETHPTHCIIIPGMQANKKSIFGPFGIHNAFEKAYGAGNVTSFNSMISTDDPNPQRFSEIADAIIDQARSGPVDIMMHSLGITEFMYVMKRIKKKDKYFFEDENIKANIRFVKIGESGATKGVREWSSYIRENWRLAQDLGVEALYAFAPEGLTPGDMSGIYADISNKRDGFRLISTERNRDNTKIFLTEEHANGVPYDVGLRPANLFTERAGKVLYDIALRSAKAYGDLPLAQELSTERAKILAAPLQAVFDGSPKREEGKKKKLKPRSVRSAVVLLRASGRKPTRKLRRLHEQGFRVDSFVGEFDRIVPLDRSIRFYRSEEEAVNHTYIMENSPHAGVGLQAEAWAFAIKESRDQAAA